MTARKKLSDEEIKRRLMADADDPDAWEPVGVVGPSTSPRPSWYRKSRPAAASPAVLESSEPKDERFETAYRRHYTRVVRYYMRAFDLPEADAHELAQDTFVRFYDAIDHYHGEAEWAFLETVIRNVAYNRVRMLKSASRSAKIVNIDAVRLEQLIISHPEADHLSGFEEASRRMHLHDAIAALPQGQRHTIQLWLDGFHYNDIARVLGIGMDAVKSRLRDARRALRESVNTSSGDSSANDQRTGGGAAR